MQSTVAQSIRLAFGGIQSPANVETQNILITGGTGSGKTNAVRDLCSQIRQADQKMIRVVSASELDATEIRPNDIVFNPLDTRFPDWDMWSEIRYEHDYRNAAKAFFSDAKSEVCVSVVSEMLRKSKNAADLCRLADSQRSELSKAVGCAAEKLFFNSRESEILYLEVKERIQSKLMAFKWIKEHGQPSASKFSLRDWASDNSDRRCVYLTYRPDQQETLWPLYSLALDIVARELFAQTPNNELPQDQQRRVWIIQDDWIINYPMMTQAMAAGRKYGVCSVNSSQFLMLKNTFGDSGTNQLAMTSNTWLVHRSSCDEEAKEISDLIGTMESVIDGRKVEQTAVFPAEIQLLKDCSCFLLVNGYPPAVVNIPFATQ